MSIARLRKFVTEMTKLADAAAPGAALMQHARPLLTELIAEDGWLPDCACVPHPTFYRQYLLHCDPAERFSLVSFVWGPGQQTPIHDHVVWGLIGMLRGAEISTPFLRRADGMLEPHGVPVRLDPGDIDAVAPEIGDIHQVRNAFEDQVSISIHLYGGNIGAVRRHVFQMDGGEKEFISGYSSDSVPNLWDRSRPAA